MVNYYIIPVFVPHKGCPHDCIFCNQKKITGKERTVDSYCNETIGNRCIDSGNYTNCGDGDDDGYDYDYDYDDDDDDTNSNGINDTDVETDTITNTNTNTNFDNEVNADLVEKIIDDYLESIHSHNENKKTYIELSFFGGSFTAIPMWYQNELLSVAKIAKDDGRIDAIRLSTRPDYINLEILTNLKAYGVDVIELGVQSMDEEVLLASERGHDAKDVIDASTLIKEYGFKLGLQMMIGLPKDNLQKDLYTAKEIIKLKPDFVRIYPTLVIKETKLEENFYNGSYKPLDLDEALAYSKELYELFTFHKIQIIRLGLQPTEQISIDGDVVAGPFHPAFRELVESIVLNDMLQFGVKEFFSDAKEVTIEISPKSISKLFADKKRFFNQSLKNLFDKTIVIRQNSQLESLDLSLISVDKARNLSLYDYFKWKYEEGIFLPV